MGVRVLGLLQSVELKAFDQMMQLRPAEKPDPRLLVVQVTAEDIAKLGGEYPLQDKTLLRLLRKLEVYQPRVIGLDMFRDRPEGEGHAELVKYLKGSERIVPTCTVPSTKVPQGVAPPPGISDEQPGFADVVSDPDDVVRRHLLAMKPPAASSCSTYYALSFQVARHYLKSKGIPLEIITKNQLQLGSSVLKRLEAHTGFYHKKVSTDGFQFLLNYRSNQSLPEIAEHVTLTDVLTNRIQPDFVKDKIILIGVTDPTIKDNFNTPFNQEIRGLLLHTQMVSQILSAVEDKRPLLWFLPLWVDAMWILAWSFAGGILTLYLMPSPKRLGLMGTVALISLNGICLVVLLTNGCILPLVPSLLALVATGGSMVARGTFQPQKPQ
jgi:CHASE2 domain-containing sensor protein